MGQKTTTRHKEGNTFKFQSFTEKLRGINASISANFRNEFSAGRLDEVTNEKESHLAQAIEKWTQLNLTASFDKLTAEIGYDIRIIPQVLHDKDRLIQVILNHICEEEVASFEATTEVVMALCLDLGVYFHPSLPDVIAAISKVVMESGAPDVIEKGFQSMAYLFKYGRQHVLRNFSMYFELMVPLLTSKKKGYLKVFAAQSLELVALTMWKTSRTKLFEWFAQHFLPKFTAVSEGISMLLFSMMKGTSDRLKVTAAEEFKDCLNLITNLSEDPLNVWLKVVERSLELLVPSINKDDFAVLYATARSELVKAAEAKASSFDSLLAIVRTLTVSSASLDVRDDLESIHRIDCICPELLGELNTQKLLVEILIYIINADAKFSFGFQNYVLQLVRFPQLDAGVLSDLDKCLMKHPQYGLLFIVPISMAAGDDYMTRFGEYFMLDKEKPMKCDFENASSVEFTELSLPFSCIKYLDNERSLVEVKGPALKCCNIMAKLPKVWGQDYDTRTFERTIGLLLFISRTYSVRGEHQCEHCLVKCEEFIPMVIQEYYGQQLLPGRSLHTLKILYLLVEARTFKTKASIPYPALKWETLLSLVNFCSFLLEQDLSDSSGPWVLKTMDCVIGQISECKLKKKMLTSIQDLSFDQNLIQFLRSNHKFYRCLALSVLINVERVSKIDPDRLIAFSSCLEIESINHILPAYGSLVSLRLEEVQRRLMINNNSAFMELVLSYIIGLLHINFSETWPKCQKLIKLCWEKDLATTSKVLRNVFSTESNPKPVATSLPLEPTNVGNTFEIATFGFPCKDDSGDSAAIEPNNGELLSRLWPSFIGLDETKNCPEVDLGFLLEHAIRVLKMMSQDIPYYGVRLDMPGYSHALPAVLKFVSKCHNLRNRMDGEKENIFTVVSAMLFTKNALLLKTAMETLIDIHKPLQPYREHLLELCESEYNPHGFLVEAAEPIIKKAKDRKVVMDTVIKVLAQAYLRKTKQGKSTLLNIIAGFSESEAKLFIDWTVGKWDDSTWKDVVVDLGHLQGRLQTVSKILSSWKYQFPGLISHLIRLICEMTRVANMQGLKCMSEVEADVDKGVLLEKRKKEVQGTALSCIYIIFKEFPKLEFTEEDINSIFEVFIKPTLLNLANMSTGGESGFLRLLRLWARVERYHKLLTKHICYDSVDSTTPMDEMFKLIKETKVHSTVKVTVMNTFLNLVPDEDDQEMNDGEILPGLVQESTQLSAGPCYDFPYESKLPLGLRILLHGRWTLLCLISDKSLKSVCLNTPESLEKYFKLLQYILPHVSDKTAQSVCLGMTDSFRVKPEDEVALLNYFRTMKLISERVGIPEEAAMKLAQYFGNTKDRVNRIALCGIFVQANPECQEVILALNSWSSTDVESYDFERRQKGVERSIEILSEANFTRLTYALLAYNFFFTLKYESQAVPCRQALQVLSTMAESLSRQDSDEEKVQVKKFIEDIILKEVRAGLQSKEIKVFENYVEVLGIFVSKTHGKHGTLKDLQFLVEGDQGILEGICDIKVNLKTKAMNRLFKALDGMLRQEPFNPIGARVLLAYVLPLAMIHMETRKEGKGSGVSMDNVIDNLIDSSIKIVKAIMKLLSPKAYVEYLNNQLSNPPRDSNLLKRYKRQLIAVMDGFHYTLRQDEEIHSGNELVVYEDKSSPGEDSDETTPVALRRIDPENIDATIQILQPVLLKLQEYLKFKQAASHKLISKWREDGETMVLQVECTVGLVKLLQKLPAKMAKDLMNPIIPTICAYMKSKDHAKRRTTKATLIHLLEELGPTTFPKIVSYLEASLKVGFQLHVLNHVLSSLMTACEASFSKSPKSIPTKSLIARCESECFGIMAEEKQVGKIIEKTYEARTRNTEPILRICAKYATTIDVLKLLIDAPIKQFEASKSEKRFSQVKQWLASVNKGLVQNTLIDCTEVLMWLKDQLRVNQKDKPKKTEPAAKKRKSTYELNEGPSKKVKDGPDAAAILINEFILQCLYNFLGHEKCTMESAKDFRALLVEGMTSTSKEVLLLSLRCATMLFLGSVYDFDVDQDLINPIWRNVVLALSKYCFAKGDNVNHEMVNAVFKCITEYLKAFPEFKLMKTDLEVLLRCIENFLTTGNCSSTALNLLQGVFEMRIKSDALTTLMETVLKESVRSHSEHVVTGCRKAYVSYTLIYNTKAESLHIIVEQLMNEIGKSTRGYETASIIDTISSLVTEAPLGTFQAMSQQLMWFAFTSMTRDSSENAANLFKNLIFREDLRSGLLQFVEVLVKSEFGFLGHKIVAYEHLMQAVEAQCPRGPYYPTYVKFVKEVGEYFNLFVNGNRAPAVFAKYARNIFFAIEKIVSHYVGKHGYWPYEEPGWIEWDRMITVLLLFNMDHLDPWVRFKGMQIVQTILSKTSWENLIICMKSEGEIPKAPKFLRTSENLREMIENTFKIIRTTRHDHNMDMGVSNLCLYIQLVVKLSQAKADYSPKFAFIKLHSSLVNKIRAMVRKEVVKDATSTKLRNAAYQLFKAYIGMLDNPGLLPLATEELHGNNHLISPEYFEKVSDPRGLIRIKDIVATAVRDTTDRNLEGPVKKMAESILIMISKRIGAERFEPMHASAMQEIDTRRKENRTKKAQVAVIHPGLKRKRSAPKANPKGAYVQASKKKKRKTN